MGFTTPQTRLLSPVSPPIENADGTVSDEWFVLRVHGHEALSQLYELEVTFQTTEDMVAPYDDETLEKYMESNWIIQVLQEVHEDVEEAGTGSTLGAIMHGFHGVMRELEVLPVNVKEQTATPLGYRAIIVPRLWYTTQTTRTRIFQGMSVPEIIGYILSESGLDSDVDFEFRLNEPHPMREYTLQYNESDYNMLSRLAEHEGIYFFFEQTPDREKVVFADNNYALQPFSSLAPFGHETIRYDAMPKANHPSIRSMRRVIKKVPRVVATLDYDYNNPRSNPQATAEVSKHGVGIQQYYLEGKEYTLTDRVPAEELNDQMARLAVVRAQEHHANRDRFLLDTTVLGLFSGTTFLLENHYDENIVWANIPKEIRHAYMVVEASFHVDQDPNKPVNEEGGSDFSSNLVVQNLAIPFRAPRTAPRPVVAGVLNARVHDMIKDPAADLDPAGQYILMFDIPTVGAAEFQGATMRRFRMVQTFTGPGFGMHHPLHIGTEVLVAHLGGDPDRPIIVGSPPNADNSTPLTQHNPTHGGFKTRNGVVVYTNDEA